MKMKYFVHKLFWFFLNHTYKWWPDAIWLKVQYRIKMKQRLNLKTPKLYTEKLQWLKLHDRNPLYSILVDKYEVKQYVKEHIGAEYVIPTLGVWDHFDDIDFDLLPDQFVLKCTHDSGNVWICKDKLSFDKAAARKMLEESLKHNFYWWTREWPYKNIKPRIIAEKYMVDESGTELKDYKFFCFNGNPLYVQVDYNRFINHKRNIYDVNWNLQNFEIQFLSDRNHIIECPQNYSTMLQIVRKMAVGIPHVRIDLYNVRGHIYFGEYTFYHGSGFEEFRPSEWNKKFGDLIVL